MAEEAPPLSVLGDAIRRRWYLVVLVALAAAIGVYAYAALLDDYYDSETVLAFAPRPDVNASSDIVRVVLPKYATFVTSERTIRRVARERGESASELDSATTATIAADSGNLSITVRLPQPGRAARAANALANATLDYAQDDPLVDASVPAPALPESGPSGPPRSLYLAAGLILGLVLGAMAAFLVERNRPRLRTPTEMNRLTGHRVIGEIPPLRILRARPAFAIRDPDAGSAARTLRTNVLRLLRDKPARKIVVTSSGTGEGKTTVASLLAAALARIDTRVLLIDGDLRRPRILADFRLQTKGGFLRVLRGAGTLEEEVRGSGIIGLSVLPTLEDANAGDVLTTRAQAVIDEAARHFDMVIIDAPPLLGGDDAITLASAADAVILVVSTETSTPVVGEATSTLDALGVRVLGVVASKMKHRHEAAFYGYR
jgi:capsular exopolysaccharide synthesis family protein